jgi:hypothetical protein
MRLFSLDSFIDSLKENRIKEVLVLTTVSRNENELNAIMQIQGYCDKFVITYAEHIGSANVYLNEQVDALNVLMERLEKEIKEKLKGFDIKKGCFE